MKLDAIDRKILEILQDQGKITNAKLAQDIGLSPAPTLERVKKLEQAGIILSYHANLDPARIGLGVLTFVTVTLIGHKMEHIEKFMGHINKIPQVVECHHITGQGDFILKVVATDIAAYQKLILEIINEIPEIDSTQSTIVLSTFKNALALPIPDSLIEN